MAVLPVGMSAEEGGYQIERSLRFNSADSAYLSRTPASASNRKTWTMSLWMKLGTNSANQRVFGCHPSVNDLFGCYIGTDSKLNIWANAGGAASLRWVANAVLRDYSAWYHLVVQLDTTQATSTNRIKVWINNELQTTSSYTAPSQNADLFWNSANTHWIGRSQYAGYLSAYLTEVNFIDGQALDPTSFGEYNADTGVWQPIAYEGTYGTNGFYLNFSDNSTTTALGTDYSGNGNNWTPNNFSVTAGAGNDSLVDVPTLYGTDTGAGGEVRGNYATLNPLRYGSPSTPTLSDGNLNWANSGSAGSVISTIAIPSTGKWYWEAVVPTQTYNYCMIGVIKNQELLANLNTAVGLLSTGYAVYTVNGLTYNNSSAATYMAAVSQNTVVTVAFDADTGSLYLGAGGSWANGSGSTNQTWENAVAAYTGLTGTIHPAISFDTGNCYINFGQRPFAYTAPSGFKALCTTNLPEPTIADGGEYFNTNIWTGNSSTQAITGVGFQPDWVWIKSRNNTGGHSIFDTVRGATKSILSNLTDAEYTATDSLTAFSNDGFSLGANTVPGANVNVNGTTYVAWNWKAGGTGVSNTDGSITSTVSANTTSGVSIVTYTGTGSAGTVGHGLGVAPSMIIVKNRSASWGWFVYNKNLTNPNTGRLQLNLTNAEIAGGTPGPWNNTAPTSTVFSIGDSSFPEVNGSGNSLVAYCFSEVPSFSKFGSYVGNGSSDGPFVYTGFRPRYVLVKCSGTTSNWFIFDSVRETYNVMGSATLMPQAANAEFSISPAIDFLSNGFKLRGNTDANVGSQPMIYAAFAENPFKYSLAR